MSRVRVVCCSACLGDGQLSCQKCNNTGKMLIESPNASDQENHSHEEKAYKAIARDCEERNLRLRQKIYRLQARLNNLKSALAQWLVATPTNKDGKYDPINQASAVDALAAISSEDMHAANEETFDQTGLYPPNFPREDK